MMNIIEKTQCTGCTACAMLCPCECIQMIKDDEGFLYPEVDATKCIQCGICREKCPVLRKEKRISCKETYAYAAWAKNDVIRAKSSSGGVFSLIASWIFQHKGIVVGAGVDKDFSVKHMSVECEEDLDKLRGSKYMQSVLGQSYGMVKENLKLGKWVLFSGTPCQIAGLYQYLGCNYERLITQDIVCHGVPSPDIWEEYLLYQKEKNKRSEIIGIDFRDKRTGWKGYSITIEFDDNVEYSSIASKDLMMKAFLKDLCLRPSCYRCEFKQHVKQSDITLADFWGIENVVPDWDDDKGVSLVMINSEKGKWIFSEIKEQVVCSEVDRGEALKYNPSAIRSSKKPENREKFIRCVKEDGFRNAANKYLRQSILKRIKKKIEILTKE